MILLLKQMGMGAWLIFLAGRSPPSLSLRKKWKLLSERWRLRLRSTDLARRPAKPSPRRCMAKTAGRGKVRKEFDTKCLREKQIAAGKSGRNYSEQIAEGSN